MPSAPPAARVWVMAYKRPTVADLKQARLQENIALSQVARLGAEVGSLKIHIAFQRRQLVNALLEAQKLRLQVKDLSNEVFVRNHDGSRPLGFFTGFGNGQ